MNIIVKAFVGLLICFYGGTVCAQSIAPPVSEKFPYQVAIIMDGGSFYIKQKKTKTAPEKKYTIDGKMNSPTKGELFQGRRSPDSKTFKLLQRAVALKVFADIEKKLLAFHGKDKFEQIKKNPIRIEDMTNDEAEKKTKDPQFNDAMATQLIMEQISKYKEKNNGVHKIE